MNEIRKPKTLYVDHNVPYLYSNKLERYNAWNKNVEGNFTECREVLEVEISEKEINEAAYEINEDTGWCFHEPNEFIKGAKWAILELKKRGVI